MKASCTVFNQKVFIVPVIKKVMSCPKSIYCICGKQSIAEVDFFKCFKWMSGVVKVYITQLSYLVAQITQSQLNQVNNIMYESRKCPLWSNRLNISLCEGMFHIYRNYGQYKNCPVKCWKSSLFILRQRILWWRIDRSWPP